MSAHGSGQDVWMGIRPLGGSIALARKVSGRKQFTDTFPQQVTSYDLGDVGKDPPTVKSTIINGGYALEKSLALYDKCLNLTVQGEWHQNAELS